MLDELLEGSKNPNNTRLVLFSSDSGFDNDNTVVVRNYTQRAICCPGQLEDANEDEFMPATKHMLHFGDIRDSSFLTSLGRVLGDAQLLATIKTVFINLEPVLPSGHGPGIPAPVCHAVVDILKHCSSQVGHTAILLFPRYATHKTIGMFEQQLSSTYGVRTLHISSLSPTDALNPPKAVSTFSALPSTSQYALVCHFGAKSTVVSRAPSTECLFYPVLSDKLKYVLNPDIKLSGNSVVDPLQLNPSLLQHFWYVSLLGST